MKKMNNSTDYIPSKQQALNHVLVLSEFSENLNVVINALAKSNSQINLEKSNTNYKYAKNLFIKLPIPEYFSDSEDSVGNETQIAMLAALFLVTLTHINRKVMIYTLIEQCSIIIDECQTAIKFFSKHL